MQKLEQRLQISMIGCDCIIKTDFFGDYVPENDHGQI